ncbi:glycosyltransferase family 9 protein [Anthocerotibacter panamensis]|uniref:glycosyltransferase family 9 protein n=1 Tax=Anthocerotibacter panamensis TaxID=2857077 RepID=UPI001C4087C3|nr:glycosyltransferase family 9 protein [Anthocerotibacter panamensis]
MARVLALSPGGIGDQVLFFPTLAGLKAWRADLEIDVLVEPRSLGAYALCPSVQRTTAFNFKGNPSLAEWVDLIGSIRERNYDAILSLGRSPGVAFLLWLTGIRMRVGYGGTPLANTLLTHPVPLRQDQYAAAMYHDLLKGFGIDKPCPLPQIRLRPADLVWCEELFRLKGLNPQRLILLHPGASQLARQKGIAKVYPVQKWGAVLSELLQKMPQQQLAVASGPDDQELVQALQRQVGDAAVFLSPPDVGKLAALISHTAMLLCVDSAPMHLAVATGRPLVALFGPTDPQRLVPPDPRFVALKNSFVENISPQQVVQAVMQPFSTAAVN